VLAQESVRSGHIVGGMQEMELLKQVQKAGRESKIILVSR
jgi:hypothetical protein